MSVRNSHVQRWLAALVVALVWTAVSSAQTVTPLVREGDDVTGVGLVTRVDNIAINNNGTWLVEVDTDGASTDEDGALIRNGALFLQEAGPLNAPPLSLLDSFDSVTLNDMDQSGFNFFLDGTAGSGDDSGVYAYLDTGQSGPMGTVLVLQESENAPGLMMSPAIGFFDVKINNNATLFVTASIDDPNIPSSVDRALFLLTTDPALGGVSTSTVVATEGTVLPGQVDPVDDFGTAPDESALNNNDELIVVAEIAAGDAIYTYDGSFTLIAQEDTPSPIAGRNWSSLGSAAVDLNDNGDYVYRGSLDGDSATNVIIIVNDAKLVQEGDPAPGGFLFTSFGSGPVEISNGGDVLWYGDWDDPNTDVDTGLFLNDELLVQEGQSFPFGTIDTLRGVEDGYHMSNDGRYIIFEAVLDSGVDGAFLIDRGPQVSEPEFVRGDTNADGSINIADAVFLLNSLFVPGSPSPGCADSADSNDDGSNNIADAVFILNFLFVPGSPVIPEPSACGVDPTSDMLDCVDFSPCV